MGIDRVSTKKLRYYIPEHAVLDNFAALSFDGYQTLEHGYQASKFTIEQIRNRILAAASPWEAKSIAHGFREHVRVDWGVTTKLEVMRELKRAKLRRHDIVRAVLEKSRSKELIEEAPDPFWGIGDGTGENWDGKLWMEIREEMFAS